MIFSAISKDISKIWFAPIKPLTIRNSLYYQVKVYPIFTEFEVFFSLQRKEALFVTSKEPPSQMQQCIQLANINLSIQGDF